MASIPLTKPQPVRANTPAFKKLECVEIRRLCRELPPAAFKVWWCHYGHSGADDTSCLRLSTIARETNQNVSTVKNAREFLRDRGWLVTTGWKRIHMGRGLPIELATVPRQASLRVEKPPLKLKVEKPPGGKSTPRSRFKKHEVEETVLVEVGSAKRTAEDKSSSSSEKADDDSRLRLDWNSTEEKIEQHKHSAKAELMKRGLSEYETDAALQLITERSDRAGSVPSSANFFVASVLSALEDHRDKKEISRRAARRAKFMPGAELLARDLERESKKSGRSIREVMETRSRTALAGGSR